MGCWYMLSPFLRSNPPGNVQSLGLQAYNASFEYCLCLLGAVTNGGSIIPGVCTFSNIFPILVFAFGAALIVLMECFLRRWLTSFLVYLMCVLFFVLSYITIASLEWYNPPLCTGVHWNTLTTILAAIVIAEGAIFTIVWILMVLGASRRLPGSTTLIEYDPELFYREQKSKKSLRKSTSVPVTALPVNGVDL